MKKPGHRLRWILGGLVAFELVYVVAGLVLVRSGRLELWLNKSPEKRVIRFESVFTVIPGVAHVRGFHMVNQGRGNQLELVVDRAAGFVDPLELLLHRVHILGLQAQGVEFRFRKRPRTAEEAAARAAHVPPIEGVPFEPYPAPPSEKKDGKRGWTVVFTGTTVRAIRDVWIGEFRLRGAGRVAASVTVGPGYDKLISIRSADVRYDGGQLQREGEAVWQDMSLHVEGRMEPFFTKQTRGTALLGLVSAEVDLSGTSPAATLLNQYFGKVGWISFEAAPRKVTARFEVEQGRIQAGGLVELAEAPLRVDLAGYIADGQGMARLETVPSGRGDVADAQVVVAFTDYGMRRAAEGAPMMHGEGLRIEARSPADLALLPPENFDGRVEFGKAEFPDLTFVNEFVPGGAGLTVKSGRATVDGSFESGADAACKGRVTIKAAHLVVDAGGVENAGDVEMTIEVPYGNLRTRRFGLDRTRLELARFAFTSGGRAEDRPDWWGRLAVTGGRLDLSETPGAEIHAELALSDTRPLVAFLSRDKPLGGWKQRMLTIEELRGETVTELSPGTTTIRHFGLRGGKLDLRFRALLDSRDVFGKARVRYGILTAGVGLRGQDRDLKLTRVGRWYSRDDIPGMPALLREFEEASDR